MIKLVFLEPLQFSFGVGILAIFGHLDSHYRDELKKNYCLVDQGYNSFPISIPGTSYKKAHLVSKIVRLQQSIQFNYIVLSKVTFLIDLSTFFLCLLGSLQARKRLTNILGDIICERKEKKSLEKDLLGCLLNSKDEKGEILTDDQIADNVIGVLFAAQDTTASVMAWIVKYLHDNPKLLEAVKV